MRIDRFEWPDLEVVLQVRRGATMVLCENCDQSVEKVGKGGLKNGGLKNRALLSPATL